MRNENYSIDGNFRNYLLQVGDGGTGLTDPDQARALLDAVDTGAVKQPLGVVGLNEFGRIDESYFPSTGGGAAQITLYGPSSVGLGESILVEITNYDIFSEYDIQSNKVSVVQTDQFLLVTGTAIGTDAWFSINGSVYEVRVTVESTTLDGDLENSLSFPGERALGSIASNATGSYVLVGFPTKLIDGSVGAGEARLYSYSPQTGYALSQILSPLVFPVTVSYSGKGIKTFTANNQETIRSDDTGTITFQNAGNVVIKLQGEEVDIPATTQQGLPAYPDGLPPYAPAAGQIPQQGDINYPDGLPPYQEAQAAYTGRSTINVTSGDYQLSSSNTTSNFFPWSNFHMGTVLDVQGGIAALGTPRDASSVFDTNGEVLVARQINGVWTHLRLTMPKTSIYGFFGKSLKLWNQGNRLAIGAPGENKVYNYAFNNNQYVQSSMTTVDGLTTAADFGHALDVCDSGTRMVVSAPQTGSHGALYVFGWVTNAWVLERTIAVALPAGHRLGHKVLFGDANHLCATVKTPSDSNNYLVEFTYGSDTSQWSLTQTFTNTNALHGEEMFGDVFDYSDTNDVLFIASKGNGTTKGHTQIWVKTLGEWVYYKTMTASDSKFGDGFSASISVNRDGEAGHFLSNNGSTGAIGYYK